MPPRKKARTASRRRRTATGGVHVIKQRPQTAVWRSLASQGRFDLYGTTSDRYGMTWDTATPQQKVLRMQDRYTGMGAYYGGAGAYNRLNKANRWMGFARGAMTAGKSMLQGSGDYVYNSTFPQNSGQSPPQFSSVPDELGSIMVSYKEYLTDIFGNDLETTTGVNFSSVQYNINPGLERSFPFLSQFAQNFDEYDLKQCVYTYKSTINTDSSTTNGQVGSVIMATNYVVGSKPFTDKNAMLQYAGAASARVTDVSIHGVECDPDKLSGTRGKYVRSAPVLVGKTQELYDHATFNLAISGTPAAFANEPIGELWVEYTVILRKPKVLTGQGQAISRDIWAHQTLIQEQAIYVWPDNPLLTLHGQQNSIGTSLDVSYNTAPTGSNGNNTWITITFPAWYTSPTEIRMNITGKGLGGLRYAANDYYIDGNQANPPNGEYDLITTGNMTAQYDMLTPGTSLTGSQQSLVPVTWTQVYAQGLGTNNDCWVWMLVIHVRPGTPYGGLNTQQQSILNTISIPIGSAWGVNDALYPTVTTAGISITEYSQMSNPGAPPQIVDSNDNLVQYEYIPIP